MKIAVLVLVSCCVLLAEQKRSLPWEKNQQQVGQALYRENCVVCHDIDKAQADSKKLGPSFKQVFQREKMPLANQKPSREYIAVRVRFGGAVMPAFAKKMTPAEIETLIDYMQSK
ncbi:MAG: cytochrome c [Acidobacteriota bacterium]